MAEFYQIKKRRGLFDFNITLLLIIANVVVFFLDLITESFYPKINNYLALTPSLIIHGQYLWTLITSIFIHASFSHLFFNMVSLFFLGMLVEKIMGKKRFFWFFIIAGIFAGLFFALLSGFFGYGIWEKIFGSPLIPGVGASGAIFGLVGILTVLIPKKKVYLIAGPLIAIIIQAIADAVFSTSPIVGIFDTLVSIYVIISIFSMLSPNPFFQKISIPLGMPFWIFPIISIIPLIIIGFFVPLPIGNTAHLGGFVLGIAYGFYLKKKYKNKTAYISNYFK
jgi:membrane associated rhomboid family serine protease